MDDITDANQLYVMLQQWLKAFQDDPVKNAKPYYVTLAPIAIANGPTLLNAAQIQHAQDVLMQCAKERSKILDGLNLMEFIIQTPSRYDFVAPTTPADIVKAFVGYQAGRTRKGLQAQPVGAVFCLHALESVCPVCAPKRYRLDGAFRSSSLPPGKNTLESVSSHLFSSSA